jgi:signal peptidase I
MKNLNPVQHVRKFNKWLDKQNWFLQTAIMLSIVFIIRTFVFGLYSVPTGSMEHTMLVGESFFADKLTIWFTPIKRGDIISFNTPVFKYSKNPLMYLFQRYIWGPENWTKRVIGLPGERVKGRIENGKPVVYINGERFEEPYVNNYPLVVCKEEAYQLGLSFPFMNKHVKEVSRTFDPELEFDDIKQPFYCIEKKDILPHSKYPLILYPYTPYFHSPDRDVFDIQLKNDEYWGMGDNRQGSFDSRGFGPIKRELIHGRIVFRLFSIDTPNSLLYELFVNPITLFTKKLRPWKRWFCVVK